MKKILLIVLCIMMVAAFAACQDTAVIKAGEPTSTESEPEETPSPEPTEDPALAAAREQGIFLPNLDAEYIYDYAEIESFLSEQNYWALAYEEKSDGSTADTEYESLYYYGKDGEFKLYTDFYGTIVSSGQWDTSQNGIDVTELSGQTSSVKAIIAGCEDNDYLYIYYENETASVYVPANDEQIQTLLTDPAEVAEFRYFLCSASWELRGDFDANGDYQEADDAYTYTFLSDGTVVRTYDGDHNVGKYDLNVGQITIAFEGEQAYSGMIQQDSSSGISYIYLYNEDLSGACRVYWATETIDVSSVVDVSQNDEIPSWSIRIGGTDYTSDELAAQCATVNVELGETSCVGYNIMALIGFASSEELSSVAVVFKDGTTKELDITYVVIPCSYLIIEQDGERLEKPLFGFADMLDTLDGDKLYDSPVMEIKINN
ncbi:MAG: hypothetical protein PHO15_02060 [Eubacteriales bacterium]|nr:hypothetical protein [Eubacteriales bacterium]